MALLGSPPRSCVKQATAGLVVAVGFGLALGFTESVVAQTTPSKTTAPAAQPGKAGTAKPPSQPPPSPGDPEKDGEAVPRSNESLTPVARADREAYVQRLIDALSHDDAFKVRLQAAVLLGRSNDDRAAPALISALASDAHYTVRAASATA
ncbi:MAG TPA: HEAT repeat domain-containing protein, partial [Myxococcota bacterium]|nr:HEAT repeat domain-containing protein [Myxococcota bacterium]